MQRYGPPPCMDPLTNMLFLVRRKKSPRMLWTSYVVKVEVALNPSEVENLEEALNDDIIKKKYEQALVHDRLLNH